MLYFTGNPQGLRQTHALIFHAGKSLGEGPARKILRSTLHGSGERKLLKESGPSVSLGLSIHEFLLRDPVHLDHLALSFKW